MRPGGSGEGRGDRGSGEYRHWRTHLLHPNIWAKVKGEIRPNDVWPSGRIDRYPPIAYGRRIYFIGGCYSG
jgi:hypothetical protein